MIDVSAAPFSELFSLPPHDRLTLAERLFESVELMDDFDDEFIAELDRRVAHAQAHPETLISVDEFFVSLRSKVQETKSSS
jgi:putative addiction module component (TIGR02574 family)